MISSSRASAASKLSWATSVSAAAIGDLWSPVPFESSERSTRRSILEGVADTGEDLIAELFTAGICKRCFGFPDVLLAFAPQLLDQRIAVAVEASIGRRRDAGRLGRLGDGRIQLALGGQAE